MAEEMLEERLVRILLVEDSPEDVLRSYQNHANAYIRKPIDLGRFVEIARAIDDFWLGIVTLPSN